MNRSDFEAMVRRLSDEVPPEFLEGIAEVTVSPRTLPHPTRADIYTLGECIPLPLDADGSTEAVQSRIVLYYGSFLALAQQEPGFEWRHEAWETFTHELRHHLEWRARTPDLEAFDDAVEQNFARHEGEPFDPAFYLDGERIAEGVYRVEDDYFLEQITAVMPPSAAFAWHGAAYRLRVPAGASFPAYLTVDGLAEPPPGDLVVVLRRKPGLAALGWVGSRSGRPAVFQARVPVEPQE